MDNKKKMDVFYQQFLIDQTMKRKKEMKMPKYQVKVDAKATSEAF